MPKQVIRPLALSLSLAFSAQSVGADSEMFFELTPNNTQMQSQSEREFAVTLSAPSQRPSLSQSFAIPMPSGEVLTAKVTRELSPSEALLHSVLESDRRSSYADKASVAALASGSGSLTIIESNGQVSAMQLFDSKAMKYYYAPVDGSGTASFKEIDINTIQCADHPHESHVKIPKATPKDLNAEIPTEVSVAGASIPLTLANLKNLESRPGASKVLYINNWGGVLSGTAWNDNFNDSNDIPYDPYDIDGNTTSFSAEELYRIWLAWKEAAEDYAPFDLNVTTSQAVYDATPIVNRSQIIATTTATRDTFYSAAGGVAYVGIFDRTSDYLKTGWTFNSGTGSMGMTHSHESGHQMGLSHDGTSSLGYYGGHGSWGPIMGAPFGKKYVQWNNGDYTDADQQQDDLAIIQGKVGLASDKEGDNFANAKAIALGLQNYKSQITPSGLFVDKDVYTFTLAGPTFVKLQVMSDLAFEGEDRAANLPLAVKVYNSAQVEIYSYEVTPATLTPQLNQVDYFDELAAGQYYVEVSASYPDTNPSTGFSSYGSGGEYRLSLEDADGSEQITVSATFENLAAESSQEIRKTFFAPADASNINVSISSSTSDGDADLYVRFGQAPTTNEWDCRPFLVGSNESCSPTDIDGTYHIMLQAWSTFSNVNLNYSFSTSADGDLDGDGLSNFRENTLGTSALVSDTDGDGIWDGDEYFYGLDPLVVNTGDTDGDGVSDVDEAGMYGIGTNPNSNVDKDRDALPDDYEIYLGVEGLTVHQLWADADGDGLPLAIEKVLQTNENQKDNEAYLYLGDQTYTDMLTRMALAHVRGTLQISDSALASLQSDLGITSATPAYDIYAKVASPGDLLNLSFIGRAYKAAFDRAATYKGLVAWRSNMNAGFTELQVVSRFVASSEFVNKYGELTDSEFVEQSYMNVFGRPPTENGLEVWTNNLAKPGYTRAHLMLTFINSPEYMTKQSTLQTLKNLYLVMTNDVIDSTRLARQDVIFGDDSYPVESVMRDNLMAFNFFKAMSPQTSSALLDADADSLPLRVEFTDGFDITTMDSPVNTSTAELVRQVSRELNDELWSIHDTNTLATQIDEDGTDGTLKDHVISLLETEGFAQRKSLVRLFKAVLGSDMHSSAFQVYLGKLLEGDLREPQVAARLIASPAFSNRFGANLSNSEFVETIYSNIFGGTISENSKAYWVGLLDNGLPRANYAFNLSESPASVDTHLNSDTLSVLHLALLRNKANTVAVNDFETRVSGLSGEAYNDAVAAYAVELIRSTEFINRF
ncbi:DUF4214 domain-containing protein [Pseudoalteromonas sp. YIC-656]|uniref:DUF4214 domain-containing protein n=1 Tax=Pseudoalteromonas pernae TaxID=3118054 RepID=UPI0032420DD5